MDISLPRRAEARSLQIRSVHLQERQAMWVDRLSKMPATELASTMADRQPQHANSSGHREPGPLPI